MVSTKWTYHKEPWKKWVSPVITLIFWKFCYSLRTSSKGLIWCINNRYVHIPTFWKSCSFICQCFSLCEKCPYSELFWSAFSRIRTEYGEIRRSKQLIQKYPENLRWVRSFCKDTSCKTPNSVKMVSARYFLKLL